MNRYIVLFSKSKKISFISRYFCSTSSESVLTKEQGEEFPVSYGDADFDETQYYFENGLRKVYPYHHTFTTHCKQRWVGKKLLLMYINEFGAYPDEEYAKRITTGKMKVNGKITDHDYELKGGDYLTSAVHRHEKPVLEIPLKVIFDQNDAFVVDKPCSIPVHPCGMMRHNSLLFILAKEHGVKNLYLNHRLDRLTSGITIFARTKEKCKEMHQQMDRREVRKRYLARVEGEFPDGMITCDKPLKRIRNKIGISLVKDTGKSSITEFEKLSFNGKSSVVLCKPLTGRMHQIRVHLQYLGYPITNDPLYNSHIFGRQKGKYGEIGKTIETLLKDLLTEHLKIFNMRKHLQTFNVKETILPKNVNSEKQLSWFDPSCRNCCEPPPDPSLDSLIMYLHAFEYEGKGWRFETDWPLWAQSSWTES